MNKHESVVSFDEKKIEELLEILINSTNPNILDEIFTFATSLKDTNTNEELLEYRIYHLLIGSTPRLGQCTKFDLPDNKIENFITSLK
jgi:hypothetical protein